MSHYEIDIVENGYILKNRFDTTYVFTSVEELIKYLEQNLSKLTKKKKDSIQNR